MNALLIHEPPLQVLPSLVVAIGLNEAIVLQQIHYWLRTSTNDINGQRWVYNTVKQWHEQFPFWSDDTVSRTLTNLRKSGLVIAEKLSKNAFDRTLYYRIDYSKLSAAMTAGCGNQVTAGCGNAAPQPADISSTETTTETTENYGKTPGVSPVADCPHAEILKLWAHHLPMARQPSDWTPARQAALRTRWREKKNRQNVEWWSRFFAYLSESDFLTGKTSSGGRRPFELSLDWVLKSANFLKCIEGAYHSEGAG